ncbi:hypothetical protein N9M83_04470 [Candidatus Poseidonia alphae]|nr:hypothetical protein [Candidatus Poseidonia alphae]MDB2568749.1 hypothetical protein [Candidatus Poseidonia alphae]
MEEAILEVEQGTTLDYQHPGQKRTLYFAFASTLAFILYSTLVLDPVGKCFRLEESSNSLGLTFTYTLQMVEDFFELRSQNQLECYREFLQLWDVIFAVIYASMYGFWIMYFFNNRRVFLIAPLLAMVADWIENITEILMINGYLDSDTISGTLVSVGSGINAVKWMMLTLTYLILIAGIVTKIRSFLWKTDQ